MPGDEELLNQIMFDDEQAFTAIYKKYWEQLLAVAYYHTQNKQLAEDVVHEVMIGLWIRRKDLQIRSLNAYLATAVKFSVFKAIVRDKRRRELQAGLPLDKDIDEIEAKLEVRFMENYMRLALEELPEKTRLVFKYRREEELSIAGIAKKMDLSPKAVEYHITKALRALKNAVHKIKLFFV